MVREPVTTILVVDDEPAMREVLELRLAEWGFRVALAGSADEADQAVLRARPDLVISDVVLPGFRADCQAAWPATRTVRSSDPLRRVDSRGDGSLGLPHRPLITSSCARH
jgi:CheY-like chemotaxis protein